VARGRHGVVAIRRHHAGGLCIGAVLDERERRFAGEARGAVTDGAVGAEQPHEAERREHGVVKCHGAIEIDDAERNMIEHVHAPMVPRPRVLEPSE